MATCWPKQSSSARIKRVTGNRERVAVGRLETVEMYHLGCWFGFCVGAHIGYCVEQCAAMPNDGDAQVLQVPRREARKELFRNGVLAEGGLAQRIVSPRPKAS